MSGTYTVELKQEKIAIYTIWCVAHMSFYEGPRVLMWAVHLVQAFSRYAFVKMIWVVEVIF